MEKEQFFERLKELGLNKMDFANITNVPYATVNNWGIMRNGKPQVIPPWVESYLYYYEKSKKLDYVMVEICEKIKDARG